jgi:nucleoid-associated protein YgaU
MVVWVKVAVVLLGLAGLGAAVAVFGFPPKPAPTASTSPAPAAAPSTADAAKSAEPAPAAPSQPQVAAIDPKAAAPAIAPALPSTGPGLPSFDVVRVTPQGEAVVAGRAVPGSTIELLRNGKVHDKAVADGAGQFAMVPPTLPSGSHDLTLVMITPDGKRETSRQSVAVFVPADANGSVVVALASPDKPTEILSQTPTAAKAPGADAGLPTTAKPAPGAAPAAAPGERPRVLLGSVEAEDSGKFFATGQAAPSASVRLYLNDTFLALATAGKDGHWSFTITRGLEPGNYRVRVDDVDAKTGSVLSRAEVAFDFAPKVAAARGTGKAGSSPAAGGSPAVASPSVAAGGAQVASTSPVVPGGQDVVVDEIRTTTVTRGDSLWRISKRVYGKGLRYTVIYEANLKQIRDPGKIYPGQLFVLPGQGVN